MTDAARTLARNVSEGSGGHGLSEDQLYKIFSVSDNIDQLAYTLRKCVEHGGKEAFSTHDSVITSPSLKSFTVWHHIDAKWDKSWGFAKNQPGCYIYGLFTSKPTGNADFLSPEVIYIGESRAITRNCMLGRRTDFRGTVRNPRLQPYGCGTAFKDQFGVSQITNAYQAYLPMHPSLCKSVELELLAEYYKKYNKIPACNPPLDLVRVQKYLDK